MKSLVSVRFPQEMPGKPCVYKIEAGKKFFIWKSLDLANQKNFVKDLDRKILHGCKDGDIFCKLASYMKVHRVYTLYITVLFSTEDLYELVNFEREALLANQGDANCVNILFEPYIGVKLAAMLKEPVKSIKKEETGNLSNQRRSVPISPKKREEKENDSVEQSVEKKVSPAEENTGDDMPDFASLKGALNGLKSNG